MRIYEATVIDRDAGAKPITYESLVAVVKDGASQKEIEEELDYHYFVDEQIHYYFTEDEWAKNLHDGKIKTDEFEYLVGERVA